MQTTKAIAAGTSCTNGTGWQSTTSMDGVGHQIQTQVTSDPNGTVSTETTYDGEGQGLSQSNPHRASQSPTNGLTTYTYDSLGRVTLEVPPDGAAQNNNTTTTYVGNASTVTDETGRQMRYVHDGLGRLTEADESATTQASPIAITPYYQGGSGGAVRSPGQAVRPPRSAAP